MELKLQKIKICSAAIILFVITASDYNAQPNLKFSSTSGNVYTQLTGASSFVWRKSISAPNDDDYTAPTSIGFNFSYNGVLFNQVQISDNGILKFCNTAAGDTLLNAVPVNNLRSTTRNILAPLWDDLAVTSSETDIKYKVTGSAPNRIFTVEWKNVYWNFASFDYNANFQVVLYENSNIIEFRYGSFPNTPISPSATIGLNENTKIVTSSEATGTFLSINLGGTAGARVFHQSMGYEYSGISSGPDSGTIFTFTPQTISALAGTYTVGGTSPNFPTLSEGAMSLNRNGISAPVVINIRPGTYDDIFHLINVAGTSGTNILTVIKESGTVTLSPTGGTSSTNSPGASTGDAIIRLDGTQYTTINGLSLIDNALNASAETKYDIGICVSNYINTTLAGQTIVGARFNTLKNLSIDMNAITGSINGGATGIRFGTIGANADTSKTNSYNTIADCNIEDFFAHAIKLYGFSGLVPDAGNKITAYSRAKFFS